MFLNIVFLYVQKIQNWKQYMINSLIILRRGLTWSKVNMVELLLTSNRFTNQCEAWTKAKSRAQCHRILLTSSHNSSQHQTSLIAFQSIFLFKPNVLPFLMVSHGQEVRCPFGRPIRKRRPKTKSRATQELASMEAAEAHWAEKTCDRLQAALEGNHSPKLYPQNQEVEQDVMPFENKPALKDPPEPDPELPAPADTHQQHVTSSQYKKRRLREEENWRQVGPSMFRAYMICADRTSEWGNTTTWNENLNPMCSCTASRRRVRTLDVVDILSKQFHHVKLTDCLLNWLTLWIHYLARSKLEVEFCSCQPDQVRLIHMGYLGGSPIHPNTAFSLRLIRLHHELWKHCSIRFQPFSFALDAFLDPHNPLILAQGSSKVRKTYETHVEPMSNWNLDKYLATSMETTTFQRCRCLPYDTKNDWGACKFSHEIDAAGEACCHMSSVLWTTTQKSTQERTWLCCMLWWKLST